MAKNNKDFFKAKNIWSEIKDQLLGCYLKPYFQKILMTRKPICYIDCFAGKGRFDDGKPGSPIIALTALRSCLSSTGNMNAKVDLSFIEPNHSDELISNISHSCTQHELASVHKGKYEETIERILRNRQGENIFLYIDPYGIKALDYSVFQRINNYGFNSLEMLINFNSFGFFRDACRAMGVTCSNDEAFRDLEDLVEYDPTEISSSSQSVDILTQIAGGDYWKPIVESFKNKNIDGYAAEMTFSNAYKASLQKQFSYVLDMPIRLKPGQRPKYRMVHVCNHEDGCFHMAENMLRRKGELFINIQQRRQPSLLDYDKTTISTVENCLISVLEIKNRLLCYIENEGHSINYTKLVAGFFNEQGLICEIDVLKSKLQELEDSGLIEIIRTPKKTPTGKLSTFWDEKKNHQVTIRRIMS